MEGGTCDYSFDFNSRKEQLEEAMTAEVKILDHILSSIVLRMTTGVTGCLNKM